MNNEQKHELSGVKTVSAMTLQCVIFLWFRSAHVLLYEKDLQVV